VKSIYKLAEALDSYIPMPKRAVDGPFLMPVEDVFLDLRKRHGGGQTRERGIVKVGEELEIVGLKPDLEDGVHGGGRCSGQLLDEGQAGGQYRWAVAGHQEGRSGARQVLSKPASITPHTKFECEVYVLSRRRAGAPTPSPG